MADKLTGLEHARRRRRVKTNTKRIAVLLGMIAAVAAVIIGVNALWQSTFVEKISREIASMGTGEGYPVIMEGKAVKDIYNFGPDLVVLTDTSLQVYNSSAKKLQDTQHGIANPIAEFSDVRMLIYEPNGKNVSVYSATKKLFDKSVDNAITSAAISNSGVYAIATQGTRDASVLYVYNKASDIMFTWYSEERISDVAVSPNGRYITVSTLTVNNGVIVTKLYTFDSSSKSQKSLCELKDEMAVNIAYKDNSQMFLVTDANTYTVSIKGETVNKYSYEQNTLSGCDIDASNNVVLMLGEYEDLRKTEFVILDGNCNEVANFEFESDVIDFKAQNNITVLTEYGVYEYDYSGVLNASLELVSGRRVACGSGYVYACTSDGIEKLATKSGDVVPKE